MDRVRGNRPARRRTQPAFSSSFESTDTAFSAENIQVRSPTMPFTTTPQTAPQARRGNRQSSIPGTQSFSFAASSPTTSKGKALRKRARIFGVDGPADDEDEPPKKGTHNLRKRPKIDYSAQDFEDEVPEIALAAPRTATRKKRADSETFADDMTPTAQRRRGVSREYGNVDAGPASRRKTPARKTEHHYPYQPASDDDVVKDTIEVIGDSSDLHASDDFSDHESKVESPATETKHSIIQEAEERELPQVPELPEEVPRAMELPEPEKPPQEKPPQEKPPQEKPPQEKPPQAERPEEVVQQPEPVVPEAEPAQTEAKPVQSQGPEQPAHVQAQPQEPAQPLEPELPKVPEQPTEPQKPEQPAEPQEPQRPKEPKEPEQPKEPKEPPYETTSLPSPSTSIQASVVKTEIAHPQPIHINHVSLISAERQTESVSIQDSPSRMSIVASSPRDASGHGTKSFDAVVSPIPFRFTERRPSTPSPIDPPPAAQPPVTISPEPQDEKTEVETEDKTEPEEEVDEDAGADDEAEPDEDEDDNEQRFAWSHLTPYLRNEFVLHPEPSVQPGAAEEDGGEYEDADDQDGDEEDADGEKDDDVNGVGSDVLRETTSTPQTPRRGTPAPSAITGANTPVPSDKAAGLKAAAAPRRKQYKFRKLRDPSDFQEYLKNYKSMSKEELCALLELGNKTLVAWQTEWQLCGKKVDDYENAKRRAQQDAEYEKKTADLDQFSRFESYLEKDFELRGYRAPLKDKEEGVQRIRWQDRVMASAYGFEYDPHVSKVGQQDPVAQREGIMAGRQLRSQPQQTAKAAEAGEGGDGLVVVGKRTRNPPKLYDGLMQDDTRAATPADTLAAKPMPKRRGRPPLSSFQQDDTDTGKASDKPAPRKRGPRGRRSEMALQDTDADTPGPSREAIAPAPETQASKRRRGRQSKAAMEEEMAANGEADEGFSDEPSAKRPRITRTRGKPSLSLLHRHSSQLDAETEDEESRPTTSSSAATASDAGSTYGVRQNKRPRNAKDDAEAEEDLSTLQPQRKRPRINLKSSGRPQPLQSEAILAGMLSSVFPPADDARMVTFRHHGANRWTVDQQPQPSRESSNMPSARPSAPPSIPPSAPPSTTSSAPPSQAGGDDASTKDYSTMTKSEKMSASMKKRWLNGSMQNAVNKRKATLAAKKAAAAAAAAAAATSAPTPPPTQPLPPLQQPPRSRSTGCTPSST